MLVHKSRTRKITMAAVLAAVYFVLRGIPTFEMVGVSGRFTAGDFLLPAIALIAGPWAGALSVVVGTTLAYAIKPPIFFGLDFLPGVVDVVILGLILSNRRYMAVAIYVGILSAFLLSPYSLLFGFGQVPYTWLHIVALMILASPVSSKIPGCLSRAEGYRLLSMAALAFVGTMAQHLTGGLLYEFAVGYVGGISPSSLQQFWRVIFWFYPVERLVIVAISTFIAAGLYRTVRRLRI